MEDALEDYAKKYVILTVLKSSFSKYLLVYVSEHYFLFECFLWASIYVYVLEARNNFILSMPNL
jgi:hypothetical protein